MAEGVVGIEGVITSYSIHYTKLYDPAQLNGIVEALKECKAVVTAMIGELPKQELEKHGFKVISTSGPIEPALKLAHDSVCQCACDGGRAESGRCEHANP